MKAAKLQMYGKERGEALLPWDWVAERLAAAPFYWLTTTRKDFLPHARPLHGAWVDERLFLSNGSWNHHHNWERNPRVSVHLGSGTEVVIVEGTGNYERGKHVLERFLEAYNAKYGYDYGVDQMPYAFEVVPEVILAWQTIGELGEKGFEAVGKWTKD
jgi:hypothetical protein